jgi:hypothetical protein
VKAKAKTIVHELKAHKQKSGLRVNAQGNEAAPRLVSRDERHSAAFLPILPKLRPRVTLDYLSERNQQSSKAHCFYSIESL